MGDILKVPEDYGNYWLTKTLIDSSWQQTISNDITLSCSCPTLICRDTNTGVTCTHRADPSSERAFKIFSSDEAASRSCAIITSTLGEVLKWLESYTLIPNVPGASRAWNGCMLQREDGGRENWEPGSGHRILTLYIAPFERDFSGILTPWIILWTFANVILSTFRAQ